MFIYPTDSMNSTQ